MGETRLCIEAHFDVLMAEVLSLQTFDTTFSLRVRLMCACMSQRVNVCECVLRRTQSFS
jgi:hypothetical protein